MKKLLTIAFALSLVGCADEELEPKVYNDSDIIQSRSYVADYETRMVKIEPLLNDCSKRPSPELVSACTRIVYDANNFYTDYNDNSQLASEEKKQYRLRKEISFLPLSSELKGGAE